MSTFTWLGGSLSAPGSWKQPDPLNPVEPGANDNIVLNINGTLIGSVSPAYATLTGTFDLTTGSIAAGGVNITGGSVNQTGGSLSGSSGELFGGLTAMVSYTQTAGTNSMKFMGFNSGTYELDGGSLFVGSSGEYIGDTAGRTGAFIQKGGTNTIASFLSLGFPGTGSYDLQAGTLSSHQEYIGQNGTGTFTQEGGTNTLSDRIVLGINLTGNPTKIGTGTYTLGGTGSLSVQTIFIGSDPGCTGAFNYNTKIADNAGMTVSGTGGYPGLIVGGQGTGTFNQGSGTLSTTVVVGFRNTGVGTYNFNGGTLNSTDEEVGVVGTGTFVQTAGTNAPTNKGLIVGASGGSTGDYQLKSGTLKATSEIIGSSGTGTLEHTFGSSEVTTGNLIVGNASGGDGTYMLNGGSLKIDAGDLTVGAQANSVGDFEFNPNVVDTGTLVLTKGSITVGDGGTGTFNQGRGALSANITVGSQAGSDGTYTMSGGTLTSTNGDEVIGDAGTGEFTQTAGTNTIDTGGLFIGNSPGGDGTYNLGQTGMLKITNGDFQIAVGGNSSGTFNFNTKIGDKATLSIDTKVIEIGVHGTGTFIQGGGTINAKLVVGGQVGSNGTYELDAGTVSAKGQVVGNNGAGMFTMNGGTDKISGGDLILGAFAAGGGKFIMNMGSLSDGGELIGYEGAGHFTQNAGTNKITGAGSLLDVGVMAKSVGSFALAGGTLTATLEVVGDTGTGTFTQSGKGANTISGKGAKLDIGAHAGGNGTYTLAAGTLKSLVELVGDAGTGALIQMNGTNAVSGTGANLDIGVQITGKGSYELDKGTLTAPAETIGDVGTGTFTQKGGTNTVSGKLTIGNKGIGTDTVTGGGVTVKGGVTLGVFAKSSGTLSVAHAKLTTPSLVIGAKGTGHVTAGVGGVTNAATTVTMSAGSTLTVTAGAVDIGSGLKAANGKIQIGKGGSLAGAGTVTGALVEAAAGSVQAMGGVLKIVGAVTGGGTLSIADNATLDLTGSDANTVAFAGKAGILKLEKTAKVSGTITKMQAGDIIDIAGTVITAAKVSGNTLTLTQKSGSPIVLHLAGASTGTKFAIKSDGHGGSDIVLQSGTALSPGIALFGQYVAAGFHHADVAHGTSAAAIPPPPAHLDLAISHA
jgi:hypothetical protein